MKWRILPSARQAAKNRVQSILARNSGTFQPVAIIQYSDLLRALVTEPLQPTQAPVIH